MCVTPCSVGVHDPGEERVDVGAGTDEEQNHHQQTLETEYSRLQGEGERGCDRECVCV